MDVVQIPSLASHLPQPVHLFGETTLSPVGGCCVVSDSPAGDGFGGITLSVLDSALFLFLFLTPSLLSFGTNLSLEHTPTFTERAPIKTDTAVWLLSRHPHCCRSFHG